MPKEFIVIYTPTILAVTLIGVFVLLQNKSSIINRAFFGVTLFQALWILSLFFGYYYAFSQPPILEKSELYVQLAYGTGLIAMLFLMIFLYYFPRKTLKFGRFLSSAYISLMVTMAFITSFTDLVHDKQVFKNGVYITDTFGPFYGYYSTLLLSSLLLAAFIATKKSFILKGLERRKIIYAMAGCWLYGSTTIMTNIILPTYGINSLLGIHLIRISPAYILFFLLPTFYSIYKHRFFNFSYVSLYVLRAVMFYTLFLLSTFFLYILFLTVLPGFNQYILVGLGALISLIIYERIKAFVPEFVSGELREFRKTLKELKVSISSCESLQKLQNEVEKAFIVHLNFINAKLYVLRKEGGNFDLHIYRKNTFTDELKKYKKDMLVRAEVETESANESVNDDLLTAMKKLEADVCLPLFSEGNLIGFLALKKSEDNECVYPGEELAEIMDIKRGLETALMNILLKLNLEEENDLMKSIIHKKTKQLKKKIEEVNELLKQQSDFIAVTAHEFRTPLSIAMYQLDEVMDSNRSDKKRLEDLSVIENSLKNLKGLMQKLFTVQQYDLNKVAVRMEKTSMREFVEDVYSEFALIMKEKGIDFSLNLQTDGPLNALIDKAQFRQVFHNLLNNAFKFSSVGNKVVIEEASTDSMITIRVSDSGEGIPDNLKKSIFEKFRTKNAGAGIGLGLYLCKKIVELHKGKIWVEDSALGGASFCVRLKRTT